MPDLAKYPNASRPDTLNSVEYRWGPLSFCLTAEDISGDPDWEIRQSDHIVIVHLDGQMDDLRTEILKKAAYEGPAFEGGVWLIPADDKYVCHAVGNCIKYAYLRISPHSLAGVATADDSRSGTLRPVLGGHDPFLYQSVSNLLRLASQHDDMSELATDGMAQMLCWHLLDRYGLEAYNSNQNLSKLSATVRERLVSFVYDNISKRFNVADLANEAGIAERDFFAVFADAFGKTPAQFILRERLGRARWLVMNTSLEITQIAMDTGFSSHSHLTTAFKKAFGTAPSQYRRLH